MSEVEVEVEDDPPPACETLSRHVSYPKSSHAAACEKNFIRRRLSFTVFISPVSRCLFQDN